MQIAGEIHEANKGDLLKSSSDCLLAKVNQMLDLYTKVTTTRWCARYYDIVSACHTFLPCIYKLRWSFAAKRLGQTAVVCRTASFG